MKYTFDFEVKKIGIVYIVTVYRTDFVQDRLIIRKTGSKEAILEFIDDYMNTEQRKEGYKECNADTKKNKFTAIRKLRKL